MKRRSVLIGLAAIVLCLGVCAGRALWEGRVALAAGDAALAAGDPESAVRSWRRAARWYLPLAPHVGTAYDKLEGLAKFAEEQADTKLALAAWTGVRSSVRATRSFYTPHQDRLARADERIAALMASLETDRGDTFEERQAWHYSLLKMDQMPSVLWSIIALLGLALWIGGGFAFALRAVDDNDRLVPKAAAYSGAGTAVGLLVWLTGLYFA